MIFLLLACCSCATIKNDIKYEFTDVVKPQKDILKGENNCTIKIFQGIYAENKIYISWTASSDYDGLYFIIDKSYDNKTFQPAFIKIGTISPKEFELLYCAVDADVETAKTKQIFYRIRVIKQYEFSDEIFSEKIQKNILYPTIAVSVKTKSGTYNLFQSQTKSESGNNSSNNNLISNKL